MYGIRCCSYSKARTRQKWRSGCVIQEWRRWKTALHRLWCYDNRHGDASNSDKDNGYQCYYNNECFNNRKQMADRLLSADCRLQTDDKQMNCRTLNKNLPLKRIPKSVNECQ